MGWPRWSDGWLRGKRYPLPLPSATMAWLGAAALNAISRSAELPPTGRCEGHPDTMPHLDEIRAHRTREWRE